MVKTERVIFLCLATVLLILCANWDKQGRFSVSRASASAEITEETPKYIALTFDDGPRFDTTARLLDGLRERGASATFFLIGKRIAGNEDLVLRMKTEGHQVGNHTWSHVKLQGLSQAAALEEVNKTDAALRALLGDGTYWIRPPYGLLDAEQRTWFSAPLVQWSVDPTDWKLKNTAADVQAVLKKAESGNIILMHDTVPASVDAALEIVDTLQAEGYTFVTVEELLALNGVKAENGELIRSADGE